RRMVEGLDPNPAYVLGRRWDYLCWNRAMALVMGDPIEWPPGQRNALWLTFMDPRRRELVHDFETNARRLLARFRADHSRHVGDPSFEQLVAGLRDASPEFRS